MEKRAEVSTYTKDYRQLRNAEIEKTVFSREEYTDWLLSHHDLLSPCRLGSTVLLSHLRSLSFDSAFRFAF